MTLTIFQSSIKSRHDVLRWHKGLDVVNGGEHKPSARSQVINAALHLVNHILWLAEGQDLLCVDATTPKNDVITELSL